MKKIQLKTKGGRLATTFLQGQVNGHFPDTQRQLQCISSGYGQFWPNFELRDFMVVLVTCKSEEYPIKNEGARMATRVNKDFQMLKGSYLRSQ